MKKIFEIIANKLRKGEDLVLVTVIASSGATPRGAGARMLIGKEGRIYGTIGGGAVEYRSEQIAAQVLNDKLSKMHAFHLTKEDIQNLGMICGGEVNVFFCYLSSKDQSLLSLAEQAKEWFAKGEDLWLISHISDGRTFGLYAKPDMCIGLPLPEWLKQHCHYTTKCIQQDGDEYYIEQIHSSAKVYIFGCGHVAQELVPVLSHVGFRCIAMDDRTEFADPALFPTAEEVKQIDFAHIENYITVTEQDFICIMTRGHAFDTMIQAQMLKTPACYIGVIGSKHKRAGVNQVLKEQYGITDAEIKRITSPIGTPINAETPAEIAISIAGELIACRAKTNRGLSIL